MGPSGSLHPPLAGAPPPTSALARAHPPYFNASRKSSWSGRGIVRPLVNCVAVADVFLSYAHPDKTRAEQLAHALMQAGKSVWWEGRLEAGASFQDAIQGELERAKCVIVLWSRDSVRSDWLRNEVTTAHERGVLVPVLTQGDAKLPLDFGHVQALDLSRWTGDLESPEFLALLENVNRIVRASLLPGARPIPFAPSNTFPGSQNIVDSAEPTNVSRSEAERRRSIFLCYRRDDTPGEAGRLYDRLIDAFGHDRVFMDIDSVPLGIDFVQHVTEQIAGCRAVIVMIGKRWLTIKDKRRRRRLDNPDDLVRAEVAAALKQKVPVIPVLVQETKMPVAEELPDDIRLLARRNGIALRHDQWRQGVERLLKELNATIARDG
jgi:hypothetical protein